MTDPQNVQNPDTSQEQLAMYKRDIDKAIIALQGKEFKDLQEDDVLALNLQILSISYNVYGEILQKVEGSKEEYDKNYNLSLITLELLIQASSSRRLNDKSTIDKDKTLRQLENLIENKSVYPSEILLRAYYCIGLIYNKINTKDYENFFYEEYQKNYNKAIENFQEYLRLLQTVDTETKNNLKFTTLKVHYFKAKSHEQLRDYDGAINCILTQLLYMQEMGYKSGSFIAYFNLGHYYHKIFQNKDAISYLNKAILYLNQKYEYDHLPEHSHLQRLDFPLLSADPKTFDYDYNDTLLLIALCFKKLGQFEKAESINKKIITTYQNSQDINDKELFYRAKNNQAMIYAEKNQFNEALKEISFVDNFDKTLNPTYLDTKGYVLYRNEKYCEALEWFDKAIKEDPLDNEFWFHKGNCYLKLKKYNDAISCYDNARRRNEKFVDALNNRAVAHYKNNDKERAITDLKELLKINYDDIMAHHNLLLLSANETNQPDFLKYWQSTKSKKIFSATLISTITIISLVLFIPPLILEIIDNNPYNTINNSTEITNTSEVTGTTSITSIETITSSHVPYYGNQHLITAYIAALITIVTILLSPIIKTAKLSPTSIELTIIDTGTDKKTELEFIG